MKRRGLLLLFFFTSGVSGLIYELVWIRQFGTLFGSSVYSAAIVTAIYMGGLGLGGWLAGDWSDRRFRADPLSPLRWYGRFELGIAALAALAVVLVPLLAPLAAASASYESGAKGWYWLASSGSLVRYAIAGVLLLPITLLMGATLTLLIRYVVADEVSKAGWRIGLLYGVNTAGAALGCLATDTALVPLLGIRATQAIAIGLNVFAGLGALQLARGVQFARMPQPEARGLEIGPEAPVRWVAGALALTGLASMAMQIVWFRQLVSMFAAFRPVFSILVTVILVGIWLGSLLGGRLARGREAAPLLALSLAGFVISALAGLALMQHGGATFGLFQTEGFDAAWRWPLVYARLLREIGWVIGPAAFFAGAAFPLANAIVQRGPERVGARAGALYLANTIGGTFGSLAAGFGLLPRFGIQTTVAVVMLCVLAALACLWRAAGWRVLSLRGRALQAAASVAVVIALAGWSALPEHFLLRRSLPLAPEASGRGVLAVNEGVNETLAIFAQAGPTLRLVTNGYSMSATSLGAQRYMRAFAHVPMLLRDGIENVMVMCFGVGNTTDAVVMHPGVKRVDVVDLSHDVLEHSEHFAMVNGRPLDDARVDVYVNDARHHLNMVPRETYDLITGEPPPITHAGVVNLYTREFFELARSRLRPGGLVTYWLPLWQVGEGTARSVVRAFLDIFPDAVLLSGYRWELILVGSRDGRLEVDPEALDRRIARVDGLRDDLRSIALDSPEELVGMLAATPETLGRATRGVDPLVDDRPMLEYGFRGVDTEARIPADLVSVEDLKRWCPRCESGALDTDGERRLRGYFEVIAHYYRSVAFLESGGDPPIAAETVLSEEAKRALSESIYLQEITLRLPPKHRRAFLLESHGRHDLAIESLQALVRNDPGNERARADLDWMLARAQRAPPAGR